MNFGSQHSGAQQSLLVGSLAPVAGTGSPQNGAAIDRYSDTYKGFLSAVGNLIYSTSGGVTGGTILCKWQDSADNSAWADYGTSVTVTLSGTNPSGVAEVPADIQAARRYLRLVVDSDPTGGTPASIVAAAASLMGARLLPA